MSETTTDRLLVAHPSPLRRGIKAYLCPDREWFKETSTIVNNV